jgi:hypothetical protein
MCLEKVIMTMRVLYKDNTYDMGVAFVPHGMIEIGKIKMLYRYPEKKKVAIGTDSIRKSEGPPGYGSVDRRAVGAVLTHPA